MAKKKMKYTKEELEAMKVQALLSGIDPSTIQNEEVDLDTEIDEAFEEATSTKKKKVSTKKKKEEPVFKENVIPTLSNYEKLRTNLTMNVKFDRHDIPYKEQLWGIPVVDRKYNIELIKIPIVAKKAAEIASNGNKEEMEKAYKGLVRYFKVICYDTVPFKAKELGYIRVSVKDGKLVSKALPFIKEAKENHVNIDKFKKDLNKKAMEVIA